MDVRTAVQTAKSYLAQVFEAEKIVNLGLEEVEFDDEEGVWNITLGFSRPWDNREHDSYIGERFLAEGVRRPRDYRVVRVRDRDGEVSSIKLRELAA